MVLSVHKETEKAEDVEKNLWINRVIHSMGIKSAKSLWTTVDNSVEKSKILFIQQKTLWIKMGKNGGILWESR